MMNVNLTGKIAAVTGGSGVLCREMAKALAANGAQVAVLARRPDAVEAVAESIRAAGGTAIAVACDVLDRASLIAANEKIERELGVIDILVNGAGGNRPEATTSIELHGDTLPEGGKSFFDLTEEGVDGTMKLNFTGSLLASQVFGRGMVEKQNGVIINISSMSASRPLTKVPAYSAAKASIDNFTRWLAVHLSPAGVRVNAIAPGFFLTEQNRTLLTNPDGSPTARGNKIVSQTPMGRYGQAEELIGTLLWLVSDEASGFVTGTVIPVDGGFSAYSGV